MDLHRMLAWTLRISKALNDIIRNLRFAIVYAKKFGQLCWRIEDENVLALQRQLCPSWASELGNCPRTTWFGLLRGSAIPVIGVRIKLGSFYFLDTHVGVALAVWYTIGFGGLWYGLLVAQIVRVLSILFAVLKADWEFEAIEGPEAGWSVCIYGKLQMASSKVIDADEEKGFLSTRQMSNPP